MACRLWAARHRSGAYFESDSSLGAIVYLWLVVTTSSYTAFGLPVLQPHAAAQKGGGEIPSIRS